MVFLLSEVGQTGGSRCGIQVYPMVGLIWRVFLVTQLRKES